MNKKIAVMVGAIAIALSASAIVVPAPSCAGAAVNQMYKRELARTDNKRIPDNADNSTVLWYIACVVGLLGIAEAIEIMIGS